MLSRTERLKRARITLMKGGVVGGNLLNSQIVESWERCIKIGLDPHAKPPVLQTSDYELRMLREKDELTHRFALAEMHSLHQQIAGSNFLIAFGNAQGTVLDIISDSEFQSSKAAESIVPGAIWSENQRGTNALGTCAAEGKAVIVHGAEHFFFDHSDVSCFAAPVMHSDGTLAGVLDASSNCSVRHTHTLALMRMAATHIENSLFLAQQDEHIVVLFHSRWELLNSVSGGLASFAQDGRLVAINQRGREILRGLSVRPGVAFEAVFDTSFDAALIEMSDSHQPTLRDLLGSQYSVLWRNRHSFEKRAIHIAPAPSKPVAGGIGDHGKTITVPPSCDLGEGMVARDPELCHQLARIKSSVKFKPSFLVLGESGTGKEVIARHFHKESGRKGSFVAVNCGALPEHLLEAELFGYVAGAFTGAQRNGADGLAFAADTGTLFLDEIGDMPLSSQVSLLRFLDSSEIRPVGGTISKKIDVQIVAATNVNLEAAIETKDFREDLFYRLGVVKITLPPLRERTDFSDIVRQIMLEIMPTQTITPEAILTLANMPWRGNIRELHSAMLQLTMNAQGETITHDDVIFSLGETPESHSGAATDSLRAKMRSEISSLLRANGNNITQAARTLGISRNTVYKYVRENSLLN
ncbi:MAG: sigma-54-dependent Fis family transcriptional regulator [Devosiaceae bacterium]|nr:sigma-54-dependent Fis family transcriptional regulator [Devosiaceae bacterium]